MGDCLTPNFTTTKEFKFNITPTAMNPNVLPFQGVQNIMASRRSFTPVHTNFRTPDLSPIYKLPGSLNKSPLTPHHNSSFTEFNKPTLLAKPLVNYASPKYVDQPKFLSPSPCFGNKFSTPPNYGAADVSGKSPQLEESKSSSALNHNFNIELILKTLGLERYCENFERAGIDCQTVTEIKSCDLKRIGIKSKKDRNCIMEMFENVFST